VASLTYVDARSVLALAEVAANANDESSLSGRLQGGGFFSDASTWSIIAIPLM
jgi:hypothetical protein